MQDARFDIEIRGQHAEDVGGDEPARRDGPNGQTASEEQARILIECGQVELGREGLRKLSQGLDRGQGRHEVLRLHETRRLKTDLSLDRPGQEQKQRGEGSSEQFSLLAYWFVRA